MPRAGTGSRSTPPAAATARARSARCGSSRASCRSARSTRARSRPTSCATAGGWRAARRPSCDLVIDVPPLQTRPKAATVGVGRQVILRPSVQKRYLELSEPTLQDQASDLERILAAMDDLELRVGVDVVRTLPQLVRASDWKVTAVVVDDELIGVEAGDTTGAHLRHRVRPRHHDRRGDAARPLDRDAGRRALDPQPAAALRRRRDPADLGHDDGSDRAAEAAGARAGHARRARRRGAGAGRGRARGGLRGRARRQRDDDAAAARHRSRAGRRGAVHHGRVELPAHARDRLRRHACTRARTRTSSRRSAPTSAATSSRACWPPA